MLEGLGVFSVMMIPGFLKAAGGGLARGKKEETTLETQ
jgi:hypothetical protein